MDLFEIVNGYAVPSVHALMISPFKQIWNNDTSEDNVESTRIFTYIELICSPKRSNPFMAYSEEDRAKFVKLEVWGDEEYPITDTIMFATIKYKELLSASSPSYDLYISGLAAVQKLRKFLNDFQMDEKTPSGGLLLKPRDVTSALKDLNEVGRSLEQSRDRVHSELSNSTTTRNQREIGEFER